MSDQFLSSPWVRWVWWFLLAGFLLVARLPWNLEEYDQAKQSFVSLEMIEDGRWISQHTPTGNPATKPPFNGWLSAGVFRLLGDWDLAWRLPSWLAALALAFAVGRIGRSLGGVGGQWAAETLFVFNLLTPRLATLVRTDMLLAASIAGIVFLFFQAVRDGRALTRWEWGWVAVLCAAANLTKGPVVYAFVLPGLLAHAVWARQQRLPVQFAIASLPGLGLFIAWVALAAAQDPQFYDAVVVREFLGRFELGDDAPHKAQPVTFYLLHLVAKLAPWSLAAFAMAFVPAARRAWAQPGPRYLLLTAGAALVVMSILPSKRVDRIYPIVPILAVAVAAAVPVVRVHWRNWVLAIGAAVWIGYAAAFMAGSVSHDAAWLANFGNRVREESHRRGLTTALGPTGEEGLFSYLRVTSTLGPKEIARRMAHGELDTAVIQRRHRSQIVEALDASSDGRLKPVELLSVTAPDGKRAFVWLQAVPVRATDTR